MAYRYQYKPRVPRASTYLRPISTPSVYSSQNLSTAWTERSAPETWKVNALDFAGHAIRTPASALERQFVVAQAFLQGGASTSEKPGPLNKALEALGDGNIPFSMDLSPFGGPAGVKMKDVAHFLEGLMTRSNNLMPALVNSSDAHLLSQVYNLPDSTLITDSLVQELARARSGSGLDKKPAVVPYAEGVPILSALPGVGMLPGVRGREVTVGEFKQRLADRGFNIDTDENGELIPLSWEQVAQKVTDNEVGEWFGALQFGDKAVSDDQIADTIFRIGADPLNWTMIGAWSKIAKVNQVFWGTAPARWATPANLANISSVQTAARAGGQVAAQAAPRFGVGYWRDVVSAGLRSPAPQAASAAAEAIRAGNMAEATARGLGIALKAPRAFFLPGSGSIPMRYLRGGLRLQIGGVATEFAAGAASEVAKGVTNGEENIISGFFSSIHDTAYAINNDHPLANDAVFMMAAAFSVPVRASIGLTKGNIQARIAELAGPDAVPVWNRAMGFDVVDYLGGPAEFARMRNEIHLRLAFDRYLTKNPAIEIRIQSFESAIRAQFMQENLAALAQHMRESGQITSKMEVQAFRYWAETHASGGAERVAAFDLPPNVMLDQWMAYAQVNDGLAARMVPQIDSVVARSTRLSKESVGDLITTIQALSDDGLVSSELVRGLLIKYQGIFTDPGTNTEFWALLMNKGVAAGDASRPLAYEADVLIAELRKLESRAPTHAELYREAIEAEGKAAVEPELGNVGPLTPNGVRVIQSSRDLNTKTTASLYGIRALNRQMFAIQDFIRDRFTSKGAPRRRPAPAMVRNDTLEAMWAHVNGDAAGGTFDPVTGKPVVYTEGYQIGVAPGDFSKIRFGDNIGLRQSADKMRRWYPDADLGMWLDPEGIDFIVEPSIHVSGPLDEALQRAGEMNQRFIHDWKTGESIYVPDQYRADPLIQGQPLRQIPDLREGKGNPDIQRIADEYNAAAHLPPVRKGEYFKVDEDFSLRTAEAFDAMPLVDEAARPAYEAFAKETLDQYEMLQREGYTFEAWNPSLHGGKEQPYANSAEMRNDVLNNKRLYFFTGGEPHPFLNDIPPGYAITYNDIFRAVHDVMTHAQEGFEFGPRGELNASIKHSQMYSPLARKAMLSETHGQNSWVNFHPKAAANKEAPGTIYSDQKGALLPDEIIREFEDRFGILGADDPFVSNAGRARSPEGGLILDTGKNVPKKPAPFWDDPGAAPRAPREPRKSVKGIVVLTGESRYHEAHARWQDKMMEGIALGKITWDEAIKRGVVEWASGSTLPPVIYHATTNLTAVLREGLKSREKAGRTGLGGGPTNTISFTTDIHAAHRVADVLREANAVLNGKITVEDLVARAEAAGWGDELRHQGTYNRYLQYVETGPGATAVEPRGGTTAAWQFYQEFLRWQDRRGGPKDPLFFAADAAQLKNLNPSDIGVIAGHPREGATGYANLDAVSGEWRTWSGEAVELRGAAPRLTPDEHMRARAAAEYEAWKTAEAAAKQNVRDATAEVNALRKEYAEMRTVKFHDTWIGDDGVVRMPLEDLRILKEQADFVRDNFPGYDVARAPKAAVPWKAQDSVPAALLEERNTLGKVLFDYGPIGRMTRMFEFWTEPVSSSKMARDARQMVYNKALPLGGSVKEVTQILQEIMAASEIHRIGPYEYPLFRGITAVPSGTVNSIFRRIANPEFQKQVDLHYGGRFHDLLDASYNSLIRRIQTKVLEGKGVNPIEALIDNGWSIWHNTPVWNAVVGDGTRMLSKVLYPLFRFQIDPRWLTMNLVEADILGLMKDGVHGTRWGNVPETIVHSGPGKTVNVSEEARNLHRLRAYADALPGRNTVLSSELLQDSGIFLTHRNLERVLGKRFDLARAENYAAAIDALPQMSHEIQSLVRRFGPEPGTWSMQLDDMLYNYGQRGVKRTVQQAAEEVRIKNHWTQKEWLDMAPFIDRLVTMNQRSFDDLIQVHIGNLQRSRIERLLNSYWLYWPISYQIKASKWLFDVMTNRAFGHQTNLGGYALFNYNAQNFKTQMASNPEFRKQFEENEVLWFAASMMFPLTPMDIGVTLNRGVRYVGGNAFRLWPEYSSIQGPEDVIYRMLSLGPIYSAELFGRMLETLEIEIPEFQPDEGEEPAQLEAPTY